MKNFQCPKCGFIARADIRKKYKFVIYVCPDCKSNVVHYENKLSIISDRVVNSISQGKRFKRCGEINLQKAVKIPTQQGLTKDSLIDLKILLETSKDIDTFIKSI
jgi:predicted RNA-binding Zn-ribbon protein involved in translation (DUF1610 family)